MQINRFVLLRAVAVAGAVAVPAVAGAQCYPAASPTDGVADSAAIQSCLNSGGTVVLQSGNPGYIIDQTLNIVQSNTVLTSYTGKARLVARYDLGGQVLSAKNNSLSGYSVSELIIDGNKSQRSSGCPNLANMELWGSNFTLHHVDTINAPCGSGLGLLGSGYNVYSVYSADNGRSVDEVAGLYADGITVLRCENGWIHDNTVSNATDFGIVIGGGPNCTVEYNTIQQTSKYAIAGINVGHFTTGSYWDGRHNDSHIRNNTITASFNMLLHGLSVGAHPYSDGVVQVYDAGYVSSNSVSGAQSNLVVDGIDAGTVSGNSYSSPQGNRGFSCGVSYNYTAGHYGSASIQGGFTSFAFDGCS